MELHNVSDRTWVRILPSSEFKVPPAHRDMALNECVFFDHIDGMYSFCRDTDGLIVHPVAWAEVEIVEDHLFLRERMTWGGRGKDGTEEVTAYKIMELSNSHLEALVPYFKDKPVNPQMIKVVDDEIKYRENNNINVADYV